MLISLNWLKKYIDLDGISVSELENALTMIGQEVEKIEKQGENLKKILTAKIVKLEKHPDSDHLTICQVDNGKEILQVICGASNHKENDIVAMAQVGAKLSEDFVIKKGKIRGYESYGMLCSEKELNIGQDNDGIMILPKDTELGISLDKYLGLDDIVFELEITPNRPDCLSHIGIARELAAYYNKELKIPVIEKFDIKNQDININIEENVSNRYMCRLIKNVKVKESPKWLKDALNSVGIRSINNIVDISNFVMLETNQPNHIFDYNKLSSNNISIEFAKDKQSFVTLDNIERTLNNEDIVVKNDDKIIALAGVMGSSDTQVDENTKDILIEVAHFDNLKVRKTSRRLALSSESSYRFERAVDVDNLEYVMNRITNLISQMCECEIFNINDKYKLKKDKLVTELSIDRMNRFIGKVIEKEKIKEIFEKLEIKIDDKGDKLILEAPSHRKDLVDQFDYFEEVIRMVGFDNIENEMPKITLSDKRLVDSTKYETDVKEIISSLGMQEVINYSFVPEDVVSKLSLDINENAIIKLKNPIIEDFSILRPTLIYSLLKNIRDNVNRNIKDIRIFEVGKTYLKENTTNAINDKNVLYIEDMQVIETKMLAMALNGSSIKSVWNNSTKYDFYNLKGIIEAFFEKINFKKYQIYRSKNKAFHPGRSADIFVGRDLIGTFGQISYEVAQNYDLEKEEVIIAQLNLDLINKYRNNKFVYKPLSKYQSVPRDIALLLKEEVAIGDVIKTIESIDKLIEKVNLFDIYRGKELPEKHKSVAISILLRDNEKTLEEKVILNVMKKIEDKLLKVYGAEIR